MLKQFKSFAAFKHISAPETKVERLYSQEEVEELVKTAKHQGRKDGMKIAGKIFLASQLIYSAIKSMAEDQDQ